MEACATGVHIKKAVLTCRKAGKQQQEYLTIVLSDFLVSSYQTGASNHDGVVPVDQISLNFSSVVFVYREQKPDGTLGPPSWRAPTSRRTSGSDHGPGASGRAT
jgi:type VI secretion system secreted protein Hcp